MKKKRSLFTRVLLGIAVSLAVLLGIVLSAIFVVMLVVAPKFQIPKTVAHNKKLPFLTIGKKKLHARVFGARNAPVILVLHGGPGDDFRSLLPLKSLAKDGYRVVFYDRSGAGLSPRVPPSKSTFKLALRELEQVVKTVGKGKPVALLGFSWGATLSTYFLAKHPKQVAAAVLVEPEILTDKELRDAGSIVFQEYFWKRFRLLFLSIFEGLKLPTIDQEEPLDYMMARLKYAPGNKIREALWCKGKPPKGALAHWRHGFGVASSNIIPETNEHGELSMPPLKGLKKYNHEVLLLSGACNRVTGPALQKKHLSMFAKATLQILPKAGHMMHLSQPALTRNAILGYLKRRGFVPTSTTKPAK